jgi:peptidoglycan/LPS O-acetylase OafA/YrhL
MPTVSQSAGSFSSKQHLPVLDGVRAIAVMMVICFHFRWFAGGHFGPIGRLAIWGQNGVDLFFVLSGFLITGILLDSKGSDHFLRNFYVRRTLRIFPVYYVTLLVIYVILPLVHVNSWVPLSKNFWFWLYLQDIPATFAPKLVSGPGHFWSLAIEEHYYLVWPFLVLWLSRERLLKCVVALIVVSLVTRAVLIDERAFYFTLSHVDGLAIGSALAIYARRPAGLAPFATLSGRLLWVVAPALMVTQFFVSGKGLIIVQIVKGTLIALVCACFMTLAIEKRFGRIVDTVLGGHVLGSIGKYSYAMYLFHPFVLRTLHRYHLPFNVIGYLACLAATYAAAWVSWQVLEKPFLQLKRYFEYAPGPRAAVATKAAAQ